MSVVKYLYIEWLMFCCGFARDVQECRSKDINSWGRRIDMHQKKMAGTGINYEDVSSMQRNAVSLRPKVLDD